MLPWTSSMVESMSTTRRSPSPGPAPSAHAAPSASPMTLSNCRTWPKVNERKKIPSVDGAMTRCSSTSAVAPAREHVGVVDVAGPGHHGMDERQDLPPRLEPADASGQLDRGITEPLEAQPFGQGGNEHQAGIGHQVGLVEGHRDAVDSAVIPVSQKVPPLWARTTASSTAISQQRGHFPWMSTCQITWLRGGSRLSDSATQWGDLAVRHRRMGSAGDGCPSRSLHTPRRNDRTAAHRCTDRGRFRAIRWPAAPSERCG